MSLPSLFLRIQDPSLKNAIASCQELNKFRLHDIDAADQWIEDFLQLKPEVAIVEVAHFTSADYQRLSNIEDIYDMDLIIISSGAPNENLDKLMNLGAIFHYRKPVDIAILTDTLSEVSQYYQHKQDQGRKVSTSDLDQFGLLVGSSSPMHQLYRMIRRVAKTEANVLIVGESGSGKELVAQTIHLASER
ncbi:sigma 54-interacting transcriptional regulator, partial [Vibrio parahaemolyticus]|nr:sigma 54-interacting transcriptional regulator [Vibrio parahaemolyticus]